jgi:hypothetical protein
VIDTDTGREALVANALEVVATLTGQAEQLVMTVTGSGIASSPTSS